MLKRILSISEDATYERLRETCSRNAALIFPKIRLADVFTIDRSGISDELFRFALQSHFDFLVADNRHRPLFAVEFDGASHRNVLQINRDSKKDTLCNQFQLPVLRINAEYLNRKYRDLDLLTWFVEVWFLSKAFDEAQARGEVPPDEPFDPCFFLQIPGLKGCFPLWLSVEPREKIQQMSQSGQCLDFAPSLSVGYDDDGICRGIAYIRTDEEHGILTSTAMRNQRFPVAEFEVLLEVLPFQVYHLLLDVQNGDEAAKPLPEIKAAVRGFSKYVKSVAGSWFGENLA